MRLDRPINQLLVQVYEMDRDTCMASLRSIERPRLDFTDEFLAGVSTEQLKHILAAACIQAHKAAGRDAA